MFWKLFIEAAVTIALIVVLAWLIYAAFSRRGAADDDR